MRRLTLLLTILIAAGAAPPAALAATEEVDAPVTVKPLEGKASSSQCFVHIVAEWKDPEGATGWKLDYKRKGVPQTKRPRPPFDDEFLAKYGMRPPEGSHWQRITYFAKSAPGRVPSCAGKAGELMSAYSDFKMTVAVEKKTTIEGTVKDTDGDPVQGATVKVAGAGSDRTDDRGFYEVELPDRDRTYRVTPSHSAADRFLPKRRTVRIKKGQTKKANFRMKAERTIEGEVGLACSGASCSRYGVFGVKIKASGGRSYSGTTDEKGEYKLHVRKGRYRVTPDAGPMAAAPTRRTVDLRRSRKKTADYEVCLSQPSSGGKASAAAVAGGMFAQIKQKTLRGESSCVEYVVVRWYANTGALKVTRYSVPLCTTIDRQQPHYDPTNGRYRLRDVPVVNDQSGSLLRILPDSVDFIYVQTSEQIRGFVGAETGAVRLPAYTERYGTTSCEGGAVEKLNLYRQSANPDAPLKQLPKGA